MIYPFQKSIPFEFDNSSADNNNIVETIPMLGPLHINLCKGLEFTAQGQFPIVQPVRREPPRHICSVHRLRGKSASFLRIICGHFFTTEPHIDPFWNQPFRYLPFLKKLDCVISTDFSIYSNMLLIQKLWNSFRNKLMSAFFQRQGIILIPAPSWGDLSHMDLFMEGWPKESLIAINSTGIGLDKRCRHIWLDGYFAMLSILKPTHIIRYGAFIEGECREISTYYSNNNKPGFRYGG